MDLDQSIDFESSRTIGFADFGHDGDSAVLWCHGGPGSRLGPAYVAQHAAANGLRLVGIDRPGYGLSTPQPGRTIGGWVHDALAVADHLDLERFGLLSISTGGAFALSVAAQAPERVAGAVICCSMTDMRHQPARSLMSRPHAHAVWDAPNRESAMAAAEASHGTDGSKIIESAEGPPLAPADLAMLTSPWGRHFVAAMPTMFAHGVQGYTDDRLADNHGWTTFNVTDIECPVIVLHGTADVIVDPIHAHHTASIVPGARLRLIDELGHFSIEDHIVPTLLEVLNPAT